MFGDIVAIATSADRLHRRLPAALDESSAQRARARAADAPSAFASTRGTPPPRRSVARSMPCWAPRPSAAGSAATSRSVSARDTPATRKRARTTTQRAGRVRFCGLIAAWPELAKKFRQRRAVGPEAVRRPPESIRSRQEMRPVPDPEPAHPNPQLQRSRWTSLDGPWRFLYDDERKFLHPSEIARWARTIEVPFPPESEASGIGDRGLSSRAAGTSATSSSMPDGGTRRSCASAPSTTRPGSGSTATSPPTHEGGHTPFSADITAMLDPSGRQTRDGAWRSTTRTTSPSRAASRTGSWSRTRSGTRARPASGRRCGSSASAAPTSTRSAGRRTSRATRSRFEARVAAIRSTTSRSR